MTNHDVEMCRTLYLQHLAAGETDNMDNLRAKAMNYFSYNVVNQSMEKLIVEGVLVRKGNNVLRPTVVSLLPNDEISDHVYALIATLASTAAETFQAYVDATSDPVLSALIGANTTAEKANNDNGEQVSFSAIDEYIHRGDLSEVMTQLWHAKLSAEAALEEYQTTEADDVPRS